MLDASAVAAWVFPSQTTAASQSFLANIDDYALAAPYVFRWEVGNLLLVKGRSRGIDLKAASPRWKLWKSQSPSRSMRPKYSA